MTGWVGARASYLASAALVLVIVAMALPIQRLGCAQTSTYALVRSLAEGTPRIDRYADTTCDKSYRGGHFYSNKPPGQALVILPLYVVLDQADLVPSDRTTIWLFTLWSSVIPAAAMLLLIRKIANRFDPGTGTLVAVFAGLATLTLPLATVGFAHVLTAALLLAAFAIAIEGRDDPSRIWELTIAGALAGFAVVTEYPAGLIAVVIGVFAAASARAIRRLLSYGLGGVIGVMPLLLYNMWASGSPTSLSYTDAVKKVSAEGVVDVGNHDAGFYGVLVPSLSAAMRILVSDRGLLMVTPIMILCVACVVLLARRGFRAEAVAIAAIAAAMIVYNASLTINPRWVYGGDSPGPRYLYLAIPFALLPLGLVFRKAPAVVAALVSISFFWMAISTVTTPLVGSEGPLHWLRLIRLGMFVETPLTLLDLGSRLLAVTPLVVALTIAFAAAVASASTVARERFSPAVFVTTISAWAFVALAGRDIVLATGTTAAAIAVAAVAAGCLLVVSAMRSEDGSNPPPVASDHAGSNA